MDTQIIEITFFVVFAIAATVWGLSLHMASRIGKEFTDQQPTDEADWRPSLDNPFDEERKTWAVQGSETIQCESASVAIQKLAKNAAEGMGNSNAAHQYRIDRPADDKLIVTSTGPASISRASTLNFDEAEFEAKSLGNQNIQIHYRLSFTKLAEKSRRICLWIILGLGLPLMLFGFGAIWFYVVQHPNVAVRWQVFQSIQIAHVLWPPFLFVSLYRGAVRRATHSVPNMIRSLTFQ